VISLCKAYAPAFIWFEQDDNKLLLGEEWEDMQGSGRSSSIEGDTSSSRNALAGDGAAADAAGDGADVDDWDIPSDDEAPEGGLPEGVTLVSKK
jgi:hypothetical protein